MPSRQPGFAAYPRRQRSCLSSGRGTATRILRRQVAAAVVRPGDHAHPHRTVVMAI
jgi:hypothetical protein